MSESSMYSRKASSVGYAGDTSGLQNRAFVNPNPRYAASVSDLEYAESQVSEPYQVASPELPQETMTNNHVNGSARYQHEAKDKSKLPERQPKYDFNDIVNLYNDWVESGGPYKDSISKDTREEFETLLKEANQSNKDAQQTLMTNFDKVISELQKAFVETQKIEKEMQRRELEKSAREVKYSLLRLQDEIENLQLELDDQASDIDREFPFIKETADILAARKSEAKDDADKNRGPEWMRTIGAGSNDAYDVDAEAAALIEALTRAGLIIKEVA